ncbi:MULTISPECIES: hypothetical protein [unclassified Microcoleus]|uniref:hypothetical protein n=1 Tax=unclassified Microcoleus TaxID=2642155 RepID=UPI002FD4A062
MGHRNLEALPPGMYSQALPGNQVTANSQQTTVNRQQTTNNRQQTTDNNQQLTN